MRSPRRRPSSKRVSLAIPEGAPKEASISLAISPLNENITIREDGRPRKVSKQRALIKSLMAKALQGDVRATASLLALYARVITEPSSDENEPIEGDELQVLRRFAPRLLRSMNK